MGLADQVTSIFKNPIDSFFDGAQDGIVNLPFPEEAKRILRTLLPFFRGGAWPLPSQHTSWQFFTGESETSTNIIGELLSFVGVTLESDKGHFSVQSRYHPQHRYDCEFSLNRVGYAYGLKVGKILRFLSKWLAKVKAAYWIRAAVNALRNALIVWARFNKRLQRVIEKVPQGQQGIDQAMEAVNGFLEGWGSEVPLQTIRRNLFNVQDPVVEQGPPTGLFGPIFILDLGITIIGQVRLVLLFMGGPWHGLLGWMPLAYKYVGVNFAYGVQLAAEAGASLAYGHVEKITEHDSSTGTSRVIPRPR